MFVQGGRWYRSPALWWGVVIGDDRVTISMFALVGALLAVMYGVIALYIAGLLTRSPRRRVEGTPVDLGLRFRDVQVRSQDNVLLRGWFLDSPGARGTVVLVHDSDGTRADRNTGLLRLQRDYVRRGYNVLAFDLRGRGESSGNRDHLGDAEQRDVITVVNFARRYVGAGPLFLHGFGLGGALAIAAAADGIVVDAVIADSPFSSVRAHLAHRWPRVPGHLLKASYWITRRLFDADVDSLAPQEAISRVESTPILLVHGEADSDVPVEHTLNIAAATIDRRHEMWIIPNVGHCGAYVSNPDRYLHRCLTFMEHAVPARMMATAS